MAFAYKTMMRQAALRTNGVIGVTASQIESAYTTSPLTTTQVGKTDFNFTAIKDACISSVARLVRAYANVSGHPFRNTNLTQSAAISHKGLLPSTDSSGYSIVGTYGAIRDTSSGNICTEQPVQIIDTIVSDTGDFLKDSYYYYKIAGERIYHTCSSVTIDVVTFDEAKERTAIDNNGNTPLPDALFDAAWLGVVALLVRDDEFTNQAQAAEVYVANVINEIRNGASSFLPAPTLINTSSPGVS